MHHNAGSMTRRSPSLISREPDLYVEINTADAARLSRLHAKKLPSVGANGSRRNNVASRKKKARRKPRKMLFAKLAKVSLPSRKPPN